MGKRVPENGLLEVPHDPYWEGPISRREVQEAVTQLAADNKALVDMLDTTNIMINFILEEKLQLKREELDAWVNKKKAQLARQKEMMTKMLELGLLKQDPATGAITGATAEEVAEFQKNNPEKFKELYLSGKDEPAVGGAGAGNGPEPANS
jgi:hypothetical protein